MPCAKSLEPADVHINEVIDYPALRVDVDRTRAAYLGMSEPNVVNTVLVSLSSSSLVAPNYYLNPSNNVNYTVAVQIPIKEIKSIDSLQAIAITPPSAGTLLQSSVAPSPTDVPQIPTQTLANLAAIHHEVTPASISHYTVQRVVNVNATLRGATWGQWQKTFNEKSVNWVNCPRNSHYSARAIPSDESVLSQPRSGIDSRY